MRLRRRAAVELGGRAVRQVRLVALAGVDHHDAGLAGGGDQRGQRRHHLEQLVDVVAEALAETAGQQEVALHVDDDQRGLACDERERRRLGGYVDAVAVMRAPSMAVVDGVGAADGAGRSRGSSRICAASCSTVSSVSAAPSSIALYGRPSAVVPSGTATPSRSSRLPKCV